MLIDACISTQKTKILIEEYARLLNSGISPDEILVLVNNSSAKERFYNSVLELIKNDCFENLQIYSFFGLVYNSIINNWAYLENQISSGNTTIQPNMVGLEISQFMLKDIIKDVKFKGYNSKKSLIQQLFRRYSLIVQNDLTDEDVKWRAEDVLREGFFEDTQKALKTLKAKSLNYRSFDYLRQTLLFNYLYKNVKIFDNIKYLIVDDADEITPVCFDFIEFLFENNNLKDFYITCDSFGSSRSGYLSADLNIYEKFKKLSKSEIKVLAPSSIMKDDSAILFDNVINQKANPLKHFSNLSPSKRAVMIDLALKTIKNLIKKGIKPCEISVITPVTDNMLKFCFRENLKKINPIFLSGNEKLNQNCYVSASLFILKFLKDDLKQDLTEFDLRVILSEILGIPIKYCQKILEHFENKKELINYNFNSEDYNRKYSKFLGVIEDLKTSDLMLSEKVYKISEEIFDFTPDEKNIINKFSFFIKQLHDFEKVFPRDYLKDIESLIIQQVENSVISENPYSILEIEENDLIIATPQKIIDNQVQTKYQLWLDISSNEWIKNDIGPLYNAWVFQKDWNKSSYTIKDDIELSRQKTARILRKLTLCASEFIYTFSSLFDGNGVENFGGIEQYFKEDIQETQNTQFKITPRDDQKPVLSYKSGNMAISAVPGAGKTTILLALIIKLLNDGVNPENIFVLTYMESAARNFREKIKNINQKNSKLPNISTIHGLALRILKDNSNYERLNLPSDFEICDDSMRLSIIQKSANSLKIKKKDIEDFNRAISIFKLGGCVLKDGVFDEKLKLFIKFYNCYQTELKENNLIDYDDILILSVKLLEDNEDILKYYQDICKYIIEDEAQDSSEIQQKLISLLCAKSKNLIRCGDVNQAITGTFTNADVDGFRHFIKTSNNVEMNRSQRCCENVWKLANNLVIWADKNKDYKNAFYKILMNPVDGKNPISDKEIQTKIFKNETMEHNYVLKQIKDILVSKPKSTIGILLRTNPQVNNWLSFIENAGFKSISRSECLEQKNIYKTIISVLKFIEHPFDNEIIINSYQTLAEAGFYRTRHEIEIRALEEPFILSDVDNMSLNLALFYWDMVYWLSFSSLPVDELAIKIGLYYFKSEIEKSNVYLISTLIKRLSVSNTSFSAIIEKLEQLAKRSSLSGLKFFSEEDEASREFLEGKIQIMTYHKSKGDEFDYVFLPEFSESSLSINLDDMEIKPSSMFMEQVKALNSNYKIKSDNELKKFQIEENLRLLYVAITRAKKGLTFSVALNAKKFHKDVEQKPSIIFEELLKGTNL